MSYTVCKSTTFFVKNVENNHNTDKNFLFWIKLDSMKYM